jgi:fumarate reductase subunit D
MELEHALNGNMANAIAAQMLLLAGLLVPAAIGRSELYQRFLSTVTSYVVSVAPVATLIFALYRVARWQ